MNTVNSSFDFNALCVGHTHEDIDQMFSVISKKLRQKRFILTPRDLEKFLKEGVWLDTENVFVKRVSNVYDFVSSYLGLREEGVVIRGMG